MKERYLLALDGGTGSFRSILFDTDGHQVAVNQIEWKHIINPEIPGSMGFDYSNNWQLIKNSIKQLLTSHNITGEQIVGISTTTMREGFILYDENDQELIGFANVDSRAIKESEFLKKNYPELEKELYFLTGESFALGALPRLLWIKNNMPDLLTKAKKMNMLNDWISYKLTNIIAVEPSNAGTTGLFNIQTKEWEFSKLTSLGINLDPVTVIESGKFLGYVSPSVARETGLSEKTPIIMGGGDAQLGCVGVGAINDNDACLLGGSFWQLEYNTLNFIPDESFESRINCHAISNMYQYELIAWMPGVTINWFIEAFFDTDLKFYKDKKKLYTHIEEKLHKIPAGSNGTIASFSNQMNMLQLNNCSPTFTNFTLDSVTFNRYTFFKSLMEATAYVCYLHKLKIESITHKSVNEIIFAGGASNNKIWCQIISDVLGIKVKVPVNKEATAFGAALLAGVGAGIYESINEATQLVKYETTYYPDNTNHMLYQKMIKKWKYIYDAQLQLSDSKITTSMWKAPGL